MIAPQSLFWIGLCFIYLIGFICTQCVHMHVQTQASTARPNPSAHKLTYISLEFTPPLGRSCERNCKYLFWDIFSRNKSCNRVDISEIRN